MRRYKQGLTVFISLLGMSGCSTVQLDNLEWSHPDKGKQSFYRDDAQCLRKTNQLLFEQLERIEAKRTSKPKVGKITSQDFSQQVCRTNTHRDRLHFNCMREKGWSPESSKKK